ncbi:MAG: hypothetical protein AAGA48_10210 [Myxococcota bacterium]
MTRALVALGLLTACSGGSDGPTILPETGEETGTTDTGPTMPLPATVTIDPPDGFIDVAPQVTPFVAYSRAIDALSVSSATIEVRNRAGQVLETEVVPGKSGTGFALDPQVPFEFGETIQIEVSGVLMADGTAAPDVSATYEIHPLPAYTQVIADDQRALTVVLRDEQVTVEPGFGLEFTIDAEGRNTGYATYQLGPDGQFITPDEVQVGLRVDTLQPNGRLALSEFFDGSGDDGKWGTGDDALDRVIDVAVDGMTETVTDLQVGPDGSPFTDDDIFTSRVETTYDANFEIVTQLRSLGLGFDGQWFTNDDPGLTILVNETDKSGRLVQQRIFDDLGPDNVPFDNTDVLDRYSDYLYDDVGRLESVRTFDPNDVVQQWQSRVYSSQGQLSQLLTLVGPGPDLDWFNSDDSGSLIRFSYSGTQIRTRETLVLDYGADRLWNTQDDDIELYGNISFDSTGIYSEIHFFDGPGVLAQWFDDDDNEYARVLFDVARMPRAGG